MNINLKDEKEKFYDVLQRTVYGYIGGLKSLSSQFGCDISQFSRMSSPFHKIQFPPYWIKPLMSITNNYILLEYFSEGSPFELKLKEPTRREVIEKFLETVEAIKRLPQEMRKVLEIILKEGGGNEGLS